MKASDWIYSLIRLLAAVLIAQLLGWATGYPEIFVPVFLSFYLGWQFYNVVRLYREIHLSKLSPDTAAR